MGTNELRIAPVCHLWHQRLLEGKKMYEGATPERCNNTVPWHRPDYGGIISWEGLFQGWRNAAVQPAHSTIGTKMSSS